MRLTTLAAAAVAVVSLPMLFGCPKEPGPGAAAGGGSSKKLRIAVLPKGTAHSFWQTVKAGADAAAKEENLEPIIWQGPAKETDYTQQINILQNQVTARVDGIVLAATDAESLVKPVKDALAKGVPVVTIDSGLKKADDPSLAFIATDNVDGGRKAADALAKLVGERGKVGLLAFVKGAGSSDQREQGFLEEIKKYPNITVVPVLYAEDPQLALENTLNMMTATPDLAGIFAANEPNGIGAGNALKQKSLVGKVKLVAFDASDEELKGLDAGVVQALVVQDPFQMGYKGVKTVLKAIRKQPITPKFVDSGITVVTKENLRTPAVQKLVNPKLSPP